MLRESDGRKLGRVAALFVLQLVWLAALIAIWQFGVEASGTASALYPTPAKVIQSLWEDAQSGQLFVDLVWSLSRAVIGFICGAALGFGLGVFTAQSRVLNKTVGLLIELLRPIPPIALVPLFVLWFGLGEFPKDALIAIGVLPPVWISTHIGIQGVRQTYLWTAQSLGASRLQLIAKVKIPAALPVVLAGLRTAMGIAFYCLIAAEMAGALYGIAYRIELSNLYYRVDRMMGYLAVLGVVFLLSQVTFNAVSRLMFPWVNLDSEHHGE